MLVVLRGTAFAPFAAERAKTTNSAGDAHAPNSASAARAMDATRSAGLSPLHWLQQRCAARTLAGSMALPPFEMGTISSSSSAYGWRAGQVGEMGRPHIQQRWGREAMRLRSAERAE